MRTWYLLCCAIALTFMSCKKDSTDDLFPNNSTQLINFSEIEAGQQSRYVLLKGEDIRDESNPDFEYIADTLVMEVVTEDENGWLMKEFLTDGSVSRNGQNNVAFADSTWYYYLQLDNNMLTIFNYDERYNSRIFFFQHSDSEGLMLHNIANPIIEIEGWKPKRTFEEGEYLPAMTQNYEQFGIMYSHLNVIIDNRPMEYNEPGHTHIFSADNGLVRAIQYSAQTGVGVGWDLVD